MSQDKRVTVTITLDINAEAWMDEYGCEAEEIEDDVENHAVNTVVEHFRSLGLLSDPDEA